MTLVACAAPPTHVPTQPAAQPPTTVFVAMAPGPEPTDDDLSNELAGLDDSSAERRAQAAREIGFRGALHLGPRLLARLDQERDPAAIDGLCLGLALLGVQETIPRARTLLEDPSPEIRASAATSLVMLKDLPSFARLATDLETGRLPGGLCEAVLAEIGAPAGEKVFRRLAASSDLDRRRTGLIGLHRIDPRLAAADLRRDLSSSDASTRSFAATHLAWLQDRAAFAVLREIGLWNPCQNAYSDPAVWSRLGALHLRCRDLATHSLGEVLEAVAQESGIPITIDAGVDSRLRSARFGAHRLEVVSFEPTALVVLIGLGSRMLEPDRRVEATWLARDGKIRIVSLAEATKFWRTFDLP
jgi:HEAT repeat protein